MHHPYYNDQAYIAEQFHFIDDNTSENSRLAFFKINSYKLALTNAAYCASQEELFNIIRKSLLNFVEPITVLANSGFYEAEVDN